MDYRAWYEEGQKILFDKSVKNTENMVIHLHKLLYYYCGWLSNLYAVVSNMDVPTKFHSVWRDVTALGPEFEPNASVGGVRILVAFVDKIHAIASTIGAMMQEADPFNEKFDPTRILDTQAGVSDTIVKNLLDEYEKKIAEAHADTASLYEMARSENSDIAKVADILQTQDDLVFNLNMWFSEEIEKIIINAIKSDMSVEDLIIASDVTALQAYLGSDILAVKIYYNLRNTANGREVFQGFIERIVNPLAFTKTKYNPIKVESTSYDVDWIDLHDFMEIRAMAPDNVGQRMRNLLETLRELPKDSFDNKDIEWAIKVYRAERTKNERDRSGGVLLWPTIET